MLEKLLDEDDDVSEKARTELAALEPAAQADIVKQILAGLGEIEEPERAFAALASTADKAAWKHLTDIADDEDEELKETLADALGLAKGERPELFDLLFDLCEDDGAIVKDNALDALANLASPRAIPRLLELEDPNVPKLADALLACVKDAADTSAVLERLDEWLDSPVHANHGYHGAVELGSRATSLIPKLTERLSAEKDWHQMHATCALHAITGEQKYFDAMLKALGGKRADPRVIAAERLKDMGVEVVPVLEELQKSGNEQQQKEAASILKVIQRRAARRAG